MATPLPKEGNSFPTPGGPAQRRTLDRVASFRVTYVAIFGFLLLYVFTVKGAEALLERHFRRAAVQAVRVDPNRGPVGQQIQAAMDALVRGSLWTSLGGVRVQAFVLGADGSPIYFGARTPTPEVEPDPALAAAEAERLLPVSVDVTLSVPHNALLANGILVSYAAVLLSGLFLHSRAVARREAAELDAAVAARVATAQRAGEIEVELASVRQRLTDVDAHESLYLDEIHALQTERSELQERLAGLARREEELRAKAARATELDGERDTLEDLLDEALRDLRAKDDEIARLQSRLESNAPAPAGGGGRARETEQLGRRLRTLYKNLEIEDRAVRDLVALRDEAMKLKAEEAMKRLCDEADNVAVRRKVGGLPPALSIFELGFAGKGRIYYTHGVQRRFRVLCVGAKNTQKTDLEYLSQLKL